MTSCFKGATKLIAATLAVLTAALTPTVFLGQNKVFAASEKTKYIKSLRVFADSGADSGDAKKWCDKQPENKDSDPNNDWGLYSDDLNDDAEGDLKKSVGVYLCYQTTTNPNEAIRDLAVMNEQGNYSEGAYEQILKEQREMYADMVTDTKTMIEEYRTNYKKGLPTAVQAHDFMNNYKEDDSGKLFGDFILDVTDEDLVEVLLQANGQAVLMFQEQLAFACDTGRSTWLDRMEQLGSYANLRKQALKAYNNDANKADKGLKQKYNDKAQLLADNWDDVYQHFQNMKSFAEKNGLDKMSEQEAAAYNTKIEEDAKNGTLDTAVYTFLQERSALGALAAYKYGDGTLFDFFNREKEAVTGENLKELYPLVACLSNGQVCAVNETVSLYMLIVNAQGATVTNDYQTGKAAELKKLDDDAKQDAAEMKADQQKSLDAWKSVDPISIYAGVDRGVYEGGVAVTSNAQNYAKSKGANWTDSFVESGGLIASSIALGVGAIACAGASWIFAKQVNNYADKIVSEVLDHIFENEVGFTDHTVDFVLETCPKEMIVDGASKAEQYVGEHVSENLMEEIPQRIEYTRDFLIKKGMEDPSSEIAANAGTVFKYKMFQYLKIGMAVMAIALAVLDITMTVFELYNYYNRDHLPIPKYMVDMTYNADKETSFIAYRGLLDQNGNQGDLNDGGGKQWLAIYATYDEDAGDPLLAPDGNRNMGYTAYGSARIPDDYYPLHYFGKPNAPQNLTYADGANGWSFNDGKDGIYFFFKRGKVADMEYAATALSFGTVMLIGGIGALLGAAIAVAVAVIIRKKKRKAADPVRD